MISEARLRVRPMPTEPNSSSTAPFGMPQAAAEYMIDAAQRSVLFWDVLRQRGNQYREHLADTAPHVLDYKVELVVDGRTLERPVNYALARVIPPAGIEIDPKRRPFVVVDPRAGHGPGIGGFKADSEIGVALRAGHPCYFVGFLPDPMPGQTIEDIARAEAVFLEKVIALHPACRRQAMRDRQLPGRMGGHDAGGDPSRTVRPDHRRRIAAVLLGGRARQESHALQRRLAGRQLADRAGQRSRQRQVRRRLAGAELREPEPRQHALDQAVQPLFQESTPKPRAISEFERWWGGHVNLNAEEIQFIVDELFIGNKLAAGRIQDLGRHRSIDLRNIRSPIVVFCSKGDNVTPPQQALGWILDLYESVDEIRSHGQTIVYTIHETIGHLGIFVSGGVARKEHGEFSSNIDLIDTLPPGLYEAVFDSKAADTANPDLVAGDWVMRCEARTLDDIRALGGNDAEPTNGALRRRRGFPKSISRSTARSRSRWVRAMANAPAAEWMQRMHPLRLQYEFFSDANPMMASVAALAEQVAARPQARRRGQSVCSRCRRTCRARSSRRSTPGANATEALSERTFLAVYGRRRCRRRSASIPRGTQPLRRRRPRIRCTANFWRSGSPS